MGLKEKLDYENVVKIAFKDCGLELLSNESDYKNCHSKLEYICTKHRNIGVQKYSYNDVKHRIKRNSLGCPECSRERNMHKKISGVYLITNVVNGKKYVGQSWDIYKRWQNHKTTLRGDYHGNIYLQRSWNKYGEDNFKFEILKKCKTQNELDEWEIKYISMYNSSNPNYGYNNDLGGSGGKKSEEFKQHLSLIKRGEKSDLTQEDVRHIKMAIFLGIDRKEIFEKYNTNRAVVTALCTGQTFSYILPELTKYTKDIGEYYRNIRKTEILKVYDEVLSISKTVKITGYSNSVVEKTIYANRKTTNDGKYYDIYKKVFDMYNNGIKKYIIAKELEISPSTVDRYLSGTNIPYRKPSNKKTSLKMEKDVIDLYKSGKNLKEISNTYDVSDTTIRYIVDKYKNIDNYYEELVGLT